MNVSGQQPLSTALKLPIPRLPNTTTSLSTKIPEMLIPNNWSPNTNSQFPTTLPSTQQVVTCQQMLTTSSMGKSQNKRGRKPLSKMPETKKHIQNLTNQRAFRRRREDYVRTLESKAATYEMLYNEAQSNIKILRDRLASLERKLAAKAQENNNDKSSMYQENDTNSDISMNNYNDNRTMAPFSFNESYKSSTTPPSSVESVEDIINNPVFCETKEGDLCFCETVEGDNVEKEQLSVNRYYIDQKEGKRMWIIPKQSMVNQLTPYSNVNACNDSRGCCPTIPSPENPQWRQENYYTPSPSPVEPSTSNFTHHHPLNLRLILGDNNSDESGDDSA